MSKANALLLGAALGAGAMYYFDPRLGNRRRKLFFDQMNRLSHETAEGLDAAWRDLSHRAYGTLAEARSLVRRDHASDEVICDRVRSKIGRCLSHPAAVRVEAADGHVVLSGPVLADEVEGLMSTVRGVRGVHAVENHLDIHDEAGNVSALQGQGRHRGETAGLMQSNWSPSARWLAGAAGALLIANCAASRSAAGMLGGLVGMGLFARAAGNLDWGRTFGVSGGRRSIDIAKTIQIEAPVEEVFDFFSQPENYSRITSAFSKIEDLGGGCFAKEMMVAGTRFRFEERITRSSPQQAIDVASEPGSMLQYLKRLRFQPTEKGGTRLSVLFSYNPPGGVFAHAAASALGFDPKTLLDDLLMRAKSFLETGKEPHDAARHAGSGSAPPLASSRAGSEQYSSNSQPTSATPASTAWKMARPGSSGEGEQSATWPAAQPQRPERQEQAGRFPPM